MITKNNPRVMVISGIDTGVGKTVATGLLARWFRDTGTNVITMKMVQTGCAGISEDIIEHRKLTGIDMVEEDAMGTTCPYVFKVPCSPHLAARLDGAVINPDVISGCIDELAANYDQILLEGAGGLHVPLNEETAIVDFLENKKWPVVLVTGPRLGSINHTLSALEILHNRTIQIQGIIYNLDGIEKTDPRIVEDSREIFSRKLESLGLGGRICDIPNIGCTSSYCVDFSPLFNESKKGR